MEAFTYKGITDGKYVEGDIEALNLDEASHKLKEQKIIITNLVRTSKKKMLLKKKRKKIYLTQNEIQKLIDKKKDVENVESDIEDNIDELIKDENIVDLEDKDQADPTTA